MFYPKSGLKPTKDMTRQAIFNIVRLQVKGARVCDLFAGGGALGMEALSRGAHEAVFVEQHPVIVKFLRRNAGELEGVRILRGDVLRVLKRLQAAEFDLVFADPPYRHDLVQATVDRVAELEVVKPGGSLVVEHHRLETPDCPAGWSLVKHGRYGDSDVTVLRRNSE